MRAACRRMPTDDCQRYPRMLLKHNSTVELVDRAIEQGLLRRVVDAVDHRCILLRVTAKGERILASLADFHTLELEQTGPELLRSLDRILQSKARSARIHTEAGCIAAENERAMKKSTEHGATDLRDFSAGPRMIHVERTRPRCWARRGAALAWILLHLIYACTNLFYYQRLRLELRHTRAKPDALACRLRSRSGWTHRRRICALRIGKDSRPRHSRGAGIDPDAWRKAISPRVAVFKPLRLGRRHRVRRSVRRRGAHHHDRGVRGLCCWASSFTSRTPSAPRCWWRVRQRA